MAKVMEKAGAKAPTKAKANSDVKFGVHSEVGQLRKVMVCAPGRAHQRLTPSNCDELLFDDVLWVENAKRDHFDFMQKLRDRGVDVVEMHNLLAETVAVAAGRKWILDNQVVPDQVGLGFIDELRSYLEDLDDRELAATFIGGLSRHDVLDLRPRDAQPALLAGAARGDDPHDGDRSVPPGLRRQGQRLVGRSDE